MTKLKSQKKFLSSKKKCCLVGLPPGDNFINILQADISLLMPKNTQSKEKVQRTLSYEKVARKMLTILEAIL